MPERTATNVDARAASLGGGGGGEGGQLARLFLSLLLLALATGSAVVFLASFDLVDAGRLLPKAVEHELEGSAAGWSTARVALALGSLLVGLLCLGLFFRSLGGAGRSRAAGALHVLVSDDRGLVLVESRGVAAVATAAVLRTQGLVDAKVGVSGSGVSPVRLQVRAWARPGIDLKRAGDEARRRATEAVETLVGLEVQDATVRLEVLSIDQLVRIVE
jgi:hypothetical protein